GDAGDSPILGPAGKTGRKIPAHRTSGPARRATSIPPMTHPRISAVRDRSSGHGQLRCRVPAVLTAGAPPGRRGRARRSRFVGNQVRLPGGSGKVGGDDVGGVAVEAAAGPTW